MRLLNRGCLKLIFKIQAVAFMSSLLRRNHFMANQWSSSASLLVTIIKLDSFLELSKFSLQIRSETKDLIFINDEVSRFSGEDAMKN